MGMDLPRVGTMEPGSLTHTVTCGGGKRTAVGVGRYFFPFFFHAQRVLGNPP